MIGNDVHGRSLIIPNTFNIKYMYIGQENSFLHKIGECAFYVYECNIWW